MRNVFSRSEEEILKVLGRRKMSVQQITEKFFSDSTRVEPMQPNNYIGSALRRIAKKAEHFDLNWRLAGKRDSQGRTVWRVPRKSER